jgi:hypothetical protein
VSPSATAGALVGRAAQSSPGQDEESASAHFAEKKSVYKSSNGQGAVDVSDATSIATSYT